MSTHKVDFTLAAEDLTAARGHITGLIQTIGVHLVGMQDRDRKTLRRMGGKSEQFVTEALELAKANASFIPPSIDLPHWNATKLPARNSCLCTCSSQPSQSC